jgi:hypothetical protein
MSGEGEITERATTISAAEVAPGSRDDEVMDSTGEEPAANVTPLTEPLSA